MTKEKTCCFSGHRLLPEAKIEQIIINLNKEIDILIAKGVINFISGGALGFDLIAAFLIITRKKQGFPIKLIFALPYPNHTEKWKTKEKKIFEVLFNKTDEVHYISKKYYLGCAYLRNLYMLEQSKYCIYALLKNRSNTFQTVSIAKSNGLEMINVA